MKRLFTIFSLMIAATAWAETPSEPHVLAQLPAHEIKLGDLVEIPINIFSEDMEIVSYAVEFRYDKSLLRLLEVQPGLTPEFSGQPMHNFVGSNKPGLWITGSATSFGSNLKIVNVANLKFELIAEYARPQFELLQTGPAVRREGFKSVTAK